MSSEPITLPVDARLQHVSFQDYGNDVVVAWGHIFGDRKMRWADGRLIRTSVIEQGPDEHGVFRTMNSVYKIESMRETPPADDVGVVS